MIQRLTILFIAATVASFAASVATLPNLQSIDFFEGTGVSSQYTFLPGSAALNTRLSGALGTGNQDFFGLSNENYDVFYSNADGTPNVLGAYISIEASYTGSSSSGLNISAVRLNY